MLRSMKEIESYHVSATDAVLGKPKDFYFDDAAWVIRYLVVETGLDARHSVLISPISIKRSDWTDKTLPLTLSHRQVMESPNIETDKPVSRQQEMGYLGYYGYGAYWGGGGLWGAALYPDTLQAGMRLPAVSQERDVHTNPHLRSANAVMRYYVHATDGDIGHVQGFLVNAASWAIQYLIVNTSNWWLGHEVLIAPEWIDHVSWAESMVYLDITREAVKNSPPYDPTAPLERQQESNIHAHYGREPYWPAEKGAVESSRLGD